MRICSITVWKLLLIGFEPSSSPAFREAHRRLIVTRCARPRQQSRGVRR